MFGFSEAPQAWWLTRGMARLAGVSLPQAVVDGWLTRAELAVLVERCAGCGSGARCGRWLAAAGAQEMPAFCPNRPAIEALVSH